MKKVLVLLAVLMSCTLAQAQTLQQIVFSCSIFKEKTTGNSSPKGPDESPDKPGDGSLVYSGLELFKTEDDVIFE